jgi:hypothetical protein
MVALGVDSSGGLEYISGREPAVSFDTNCAPDLGSGGTSCWEDVTFAWSLPVAGTTRTVFRPGYRDGPAQFRGSALPVRGFLGILRAEGCPDAAVEMTVAVAGTEFGRLVVGQADGHAADLAAPLGGVTPGTVEVTMRRTDAEQCDVTVGWAGPGVLFDQYRRVRERTA